MHSLLAAIPENDVARVRMAMARDPGLATALVDTEKLYESGVFHWIYVGDTALHLAAAGYRIGIVQALLDAGADPKLEDGAGRTVRECAQLNWTRDVLPRGAA